MLIHCDLLIVCMKRRVHHLMFVYGSPGCCKEVRLWQPLIFALVYTSVRPHVTSQGRGVYTRATRLHNHSRAAYATSWSISRLHAISSTTVRKPFAAAQHSPPPIRCVGIHNISIIAKRSQSCVEALSDGEFACRLDLLIDEIIVHLGKSDEHG